ncbi:MAG: SIS domain-containing protein [Methylovulum sp.]|uniref:D-sedoheptulose-7-phosphate isomerase n=1 Tax=Methylovulum sp. TaxID=1916980 RepID=UPI0026212603|nr:SIS domain-containing protein [Methylovulum sp.]MDD2723947.1 SIS domain-containing protein [Methylovulum sp.]MDD5125107.1 SIS domain-containing protein [Methylovulum sp.]
MSLQDRIINHFSDSIQCQQQTLGSLCELIEYASQRLVSTLLNDRKIFACGNGRSAATAQLLASALLNQYERDRPSLPVIGLNSDAVILTGIANDHHFDEIFAKQLRALGQSGDILVVYCDSHNAANLAKAITVAHDKDISVVALTGNDGGKISPLLNEVDIEIRVPSDSRAHIQEIHILITHCLCDLIDHQLFG